MITGRHFVIFLFSGLALKRAADEEPISNDKNTHIYMYTKHLDIYKQTDGSPIMSYQRESETIYIIIAEDRSRKSLNKSPSKPT